MIEYRQFRNTDPPHLVDIWNDALSGRGAYPLATATPLEKWVLAKPYFDPAGLIVACDAGKPVGFAHGGFGPNADHSDLEKSVGIVCAVLVQSSHRGQGIGTELLRRCEEYLTSHQATIIYAGSQRPKNPFYFGLYGGCDSPGFLTSDPAAAPFLETNGYRGCSTTLVFQRKLDQPVNVADPRFTTLRRQYDFQVMTRTPIGTWWQECLLGPQVEPVEFRLEDKLSNIPAARAVVWELEGFSWRWQHPSAGILELTVRPNLRRRGLGRFLLTQVLRYLQDQYFGIVEAQTLERNAAAVNMYRSVDFEQIDVGRSYIRGTPPPEDNDFDTLLD